MSISKRMKYFKQLAILLTLFWSLLVSFFLLYQFYNEEKHVENRSIEKVEGVAEQAIAFIYWGYEQKAKALNDEQKYTIKANFSLKSLLTELAKHSEMTLDITHISKEFPEAATNTSMKKALVSMKASKQSQIAIFEKNGKKSLIYFKPMLANNVCLSCHVHSGAKEGDLLGFTTLQMAVPSFREANPQSFYFLVLMYLGTWILGLFTIWWIHAKGRNFLNEKTKMYEESMYALIDMMEKRDSYTAGHSQRVAEYSKLLVLAMGYSGDDADFIYKAGMLHDIGKIEIPDAILLKPDKLTSIEYSLIKRHATASYELLSREPFSLLADVVLHHHEHYDGSGYPNGLKENQIPFFSQIIAVADAFDAITTNRAYRKSLSRDEALAILEAEKGKQFNPLIVEYALSVFKEIELPENTTQMPKDLLEEMRFSYYFRDQLTGFYNVNYLKFLFTHLNDCSMQIFSIDHISCSDFSSFNKQFGWKKGDDFLCLIASRLQELNPEAIVVRVYSDHFLILHVKENGLHHDYASIATLLREHGLIMQYQYLEIDSTEALSLEILEDRLLNLEK